MQLSCVIIVINYATRTCVGKYCQIMERNAFLFFLYSCHCEVNMIESSF